MPSRLSSLLVRDGLVGVKRMEKAFQRQVIYGGSLDTILLEMALVPEDRLTQYLALASGLPPAARDEGHDIPQEALAVIPRDLAEKHRAIPLATVGEAIRILVCSPLELDQLEDLADVLDRPLQPLITPEYRWHLVLASAYGGDPPARFTTLARQADGDAAPPSPVGKGVAVIVDERVNRPLTNPPPVLPPAAPAPAPQPAHPIRSSPLSPIAPDDSTLKLTTGEVVAALEDATRSERARSNTLVGVEPHRAQTESGGTQTRIPVSTGGRRNDGVPDDVLGKPVVTFVPPGQPVEPEPQVPEIPHEPVEKPAGFPIRPRQAAGPFQAMKPIKRAEADPAEALNRDTPLPVVRARELLAVVTDRDTVFLTLLRATRSRARYAGLLTVQGGAAIGRVALAEPGIDVATVSSVLIPLDAESPFRTVVTSSQPYIGPLACGDPAIDKMLRRFGGTLPPSALIMPIVLRDRPIAVIVAHRMHNDIKLVDVAELLPLAGATSDALGRLIVRHKSVGYRAPTDSDSHGIVSVEATDVDTKRVDTRESNGWKQPDEEPEVVSIPEPDVEEENGGLQPVPVLPIDEVLDIIERAREGEAEDEILDAVDRSNETLGALMRRFPGTLRVDRFAVGGRPLRAAQYGGLLELVIQLGSVAAELLVEKMSVAQRDVRYYATVCAAELRPRSAVYALVERVFDQDFGVRAMAIEALAGYPMNDLATALVRARRAVHSDDPEVVLAATGALVQLGDVESIGELVSVVEKSGRPGEHARKALVQLTAQDWGASEKRWRKWWEGARGKHRVEWLIEGLAHKDDAIREQAISDLRRLTGEYFGYHHDLPKKDRDIAANRWATWWRDTGHRRFVQREDERGRPTALLPARKEPS